MADNVFWKFKNNDGIKNTLPIQVNDDEFLPDNYKKMEFRFTNNNWGYELLKNCVGCSPIFKKNLESSYNFKLIRSLKEFLKIMKENAASQDFENHYFRGQSAYSLVLPSILRSKKYLDNEKNMFNEMLGAFPNEFKDIDSCFDKLALMRSKGMPARIMDLSTNPLIALYYACKRCSEKNPVGMVIDFKFNKTEKMSLSQDIKIMDSDSISFDNENSVIVQPSCYNAQVANQQTVYLLFSNKDKGLEEIVCEFNKDHLGKCIYLLYYKDVKAILKELASVGIDDYHMNPDIENLAKSVKEAFTSENEEKKKSQEDYLQELAEAFIDRGYFLLERFSRGAYNGPWMLCNTNIDSNDNQEENLKKLKEVINSTNSGIIKLIEKENKVECLSNGQYRKNTEEFGKLLEDTIKSQCQRKLNILDDQETSLRNIQIIPEEEGFCRQRNEISRILKRITLEQLRLRFLGTQISQETISEKKGAGNLDFSVFLYYDPLRIQPVIVKSAFDFLERIDIFKKDRKAMLQPYNLYYRGQFLPYPVNASLFRDENYVKHEKNMYTALLARLPETFNKEPSIFDKLVVMKHYNFPSRLLDVTSNPLIALLFTCLNISNEDAKDSSLQAVNMCFSKKDEEKDILSDTVVRLCSLSLAEDFKFSNDKFEEDDYLVEIGYRSQRYASGFYSIKPSLEELDKTILVHPSINNKRVERQKGKFLISGRNNKNPAQQNCEINEFFFPKHFAPIPLFVVLKEDSKTLLDELKLCFGLDESFIYPEMEYKAKELQKRYKEESD